MQQTPEIRIMKISQFSEIHYQIEYLIRLKKDYTHSIQGYLILETDNTNTILQIIKEDLCKYLTTLTIT